ncbi:MAG TPA: bifunctional phosphoribosyl-AMP cyclohydrolase/phosphoribosyl-ATP diphosphatase HisIE [Candidatus Elarobacter sp.]|nr:bifunctional phosphoribosyl-AMP cyclohydrolase/phosphoribosyl-ATP diphosphatase HisIE [Dongiaceae bacterium]HZW53050.1 bifunctional phosphoribosyl-AMP cyclohydrolase/phosphoribosyl-ATP diphosphatase HisIE [Candidatus Elarobacter sp.]
MTALSEIRWDAAGLAPVVIADATTGAVLTLAYANREALERTLATRSTWLWSRSRGELWNKGATSGHTQRVVSVSVDCDADALLYRVVPSGPACHTGSASCFTATVPLDGAEEPPEGAEFASAISSLARTILSRKTHPVEGSYTAKLFAGGVDRIGKKIGEEATEVVIAAKNADRGELVWETADLLYHALVLLAERGVSLDEVGAELSRRAKPSG